MLSQEFCPKKDCKFRFGEKIGAILTPVLKPFLVGSLKKYAPIEAESVAHFMVKVAHEESAPGASFGLNSGQPAPLRGY